MKRAPKKSRRAAKAELPAFVTPQLATLVTEPPRTGDWVYEVKHDGYRMLARISQEVQLFTSIRERLDRQAPAPAPRRWKSSAWRRRWLDGEIVVPGPTAARASRRCRTRSTSGGIPTSSYYVFDAPFLDGKDQRALPLSERKARLEKVLKGSNTLRFSDDLGGRRAGGARACVQAQARRADRQAGRRGVHRGTQQELDQAQVPAAAGFRHRGLYAAQGLAPRLRCAGRGRVREAAQAGLCRKGRHGIRRRAPFPPVEKAGGAEGQGQSPLENPPREKGITWVQPKLVAEVEFAERTNEGIIRQGAFMGLRQDIAPKSVGVETRADTTGEHPHHASGAVDLSEPAVFQGRSRALLRTRWRLDAAARGEPAAYAGALPGRRGGKCFYQRHLGMGASPGDLKTFERLRSSKGAYLYLDSKNGILSAVQNGAVEFHTWGASVPDAKHPDRITMDLDPGPGVSWAELVKATRLTRTLLEKLGLKCFLKTTGGKGLHVVAPLEPKLGWDEVKEFTRLVAEFLVKAEPKLFVAEMSKAKRTGLVYVDYLRNGETASAVSAYSARARKEAGVSTPLDGTSSASADSAGQFTVMTVPKRVAKLNAGSLGGVFLTRQSITARC